MPLTESMGILEEPVLLGAQVTWRHSKSAFNNDDAFKQMDCECDIYWSVCLMGGLEKWLEGTMERGTPKTMLVYATIVLSL